MTTIDFSPAGTVRRWAYRITCLMVACAFPLMFLHAQSATATQSAAPAQQSATPAQPAAAPAQQTPRPSQQQPQGAQQDQSPDQTDNGAPTIRLPVNEVNLIFTVTDRHGH